MPGIAVKDSDDEQITRRLWLAEQFSTQSIQT